MGRPWIITDEKLEALWDRYMGGESAKGMSREHGVTVDALRKALRNEAVSRGYDRGLRLDEIRKSKLRKSRKSEYDEGRSAFGVCRFCGRAHVGHKRCKRCEVLLHGVNAEYTCSCGNQHGIEGPMGTGLCKRCYDGGLENANDEEVGISSSLDDDHGVFVVSIGCGRDGELDV